MYKHIHTYVKFNEAAKYAFVLFLCTRFKYQQTKSWYSDLVWWKKPQRAKQLWSLNFFMRAR